MKHTTARAAHAFTLIEMSVVIVIVGLLLGALVGLNGFSQNAALTTTMNEGKYYINAFNQFQTRYGAAPGDFATASASWTGAGNGDGNGLIRATATAPGNRVEWFYVFQHLAMAGFIQGKYTGTTTGGGGTFNPKIGTNIPGAAIERVAYAFDHPDFTDGSPDGFLSGDSVYFDGNYSNILVIAAVNDTATTIPNQVFLTPKQAYQLDIKYDDGLPGQGLLVTPISTNLSGCATTAVTTTAIYDVATTANKDKKTCYFIMRMQQ